ncbi:MAG: DUF4465 domain-containing protein [Bacteroidales bacterium]|nr:DUF4465 domain-containing protein [Bacteroidales bacterium]MCD8394492.1 DUF4465 domain-containing protein [Bacteroidales bacterium]
MKMKKQCLFALLAISFAAFSTKADQLVVGDFEDVQLEAESFWYSTTEGTTWNTGSFQLIANNHFDYYADGYAASNLTGTSFSDYSVDSYRSAANGGHNSSNFGVFYPAWPNDQSYFTVVNNASGDVIPGMYVTNNAYAYASMSQGDAFGLSAFAQGDFFTVTFTGYDVDGQVTGSVDFKLADYTSDIEADHYILHTWEWVDLSSLGTVRNLLVTFSGSQNNDWGLMIPTYVCVDDLGCTPTIEGEYDVELNTSTPTLVSFISVFGDPADDGSTYTYAILDDISAVEGMIVQNHGDHLMIQGTTDGAKASLLARVTNQGRSHYKAINLAVNDSGAVNSIDADQATEAVYYNLQGIQVACPVAGQFYIERRGTTTRKIQY